MNNLIVPVYLNQRIVFDLIAILEDGLATVTRLTATEESHEKKSRGLSGSFGLAEAFSSLLKISVNASRREGSDTGNSATRAEERIHTPVSLFQKLLQRLRERDELIRVTTDYSPEPGHIIEFASSLRRNPLLETLDAFDGIMEILLAFSEPSPPNRKTRNRQNDPQTNEFALKRLREQISTFARGIRKGDTVDMVSQEIGNGFGAVITLHQEYLNEPTMTDLVDGCFTVVGKVVRVADAADDGISLLRKSALSIMSHQMRQPIFDTMQGIEGFDFPTLEMEVRGPVIQIMPIAVYA